MNLHRKRLHGLAVATLFALSAGHAAADVPTIAPVPVSMRAESGAALPDEPPVPPVEHREANEPSSSTEAAAESTSAKPARARRPKKK